MRICMVNAFFHPYSGGTEKHMYEIGRRIAREEEVFVYTSLLEGTKPFEELEGMKVYRTKARLWRMPLIYPPPFVLAGRVKREISGLDKKFDLDVFHLHGRWFPDFGYVGRYAKESKKLFMLTLHNARPLGISTFITAIGTLYDELYGKKLLKMADRIIAVSNFVKWDIARYGVNSTKIEVIHNGVDTSFFKPTEKTFREKYNQFDTVFLYLGRLIKQKGLPYLIHAMAEVVREYPRTGLLIAGTGEQRNGLEALVLRLGIERNVAFLGFVPEEQLPNLYSSADVYVLPSLWEVLAISSLEAMACGIPVLVSDAGGNPEVVEDGVNGFVVRKADPAALAQKMKVLISNPEMRRRMGKKSRRMAVEKFDWNFVAERTLDYYRRSFEEFYQGSKGGELGGRV